MKSKEHRRHETDFRYYWKRLAAHWMAVFLLSAQYCVLEAVPLPSQRGLTCRPDHVHALGAAAAASCTWRGTSGVSDLRMPVHAHDAMAGIPLKVAGIEAPMQLDGFTITAMRVTLRATLTPHADEPYDGSRLKHLDVFLQYPGSTCEPLGGATLDARSLNSTGRCIALTPFMASPGSSTGETLGHAGLDNASLPQQTTQDGNERVRASSAGTPAACDDHAWERTFTADSRQLQAQGDRSRGVLQETPGAWQLPLSGSASGTYHLFIADHGHAHAQRNHGENDRLLLLEWSLEMQYGVWEDPMQDLAGSSHGARRRLAQIVSAYALMLGLLLGALRALKASACLLAQGRLALSYGMHVAHVMPADGM